MRPLFLVLSLCVTWTSVARGQKPVLPGKPPARSLSELIHVIRSPAHSVDRTQAAEEVAGFGRNAVEPLCELLRDEDNAIRMSVLLVFMRMGPEAEAAVPLLIEIAAHARQDLRIAAIDALGAVGPAGAESVPTLKNMILSDNEELRQKALNALALIGGSAALASLEQAFQQGSPELRVAVLKALEKTPEATAALMPMLVAEFTRGNSRMGDHLLGLMILAPEAAVGSLMESLKSERIQSRRRAMMALCRPRLARAAAGAVAVLTEMLSDADPVSRFWAVKALGAIGSPAHSAAPSLIACLSDTDADVRWQAIGTLGRLGLARQAAEELERLRFDPHPAVREAAEELSRSLEPSSGESS
jgi:HEAT repeat protein